MPVTHHELCFGCGQQNLFGLQIEVEPQPAGGVAGRMFLKQDHQGPPGAAHPGLIATALEEVMSLALEAEGVRALPESFEVHIERPAPLGVFVRLEARSVAEAGDGPIPVPAEASLAGVEAGPVASARATFVPYDDADASSRVAPSGGSPGRPPSGS